MLNARTRQNLAYRLERDMPVIYIIISADIMIVQKNNTGDCDSSIIRLYIILLKLLANNNVVNINIVEMISVCDVCNVIKDFLSSGVRGNRLNM
ncbi:MAG: hypothetical protein UIH99_01190 [Alphaproteobacteria bacterium]|nr:hypothetical protein [Alphaproteobacteria bacterium]